MSDLLPVGLQQVGGTTAESLCYDLAFDEPFQGLGMLSGKDADGIFKTELSTRDLSSESLLHNLQGS